MNSARVQRSPRSWREFRGVCVGLLCVLVVACGEDAEPLAPGGAEGPGGVPGPAGTSLDPEHPIQLQDGSSTGTPPAGSGPSDPVGPDAPGPDAPGPAPWTAAPALRDPIALSDAELAQQALELLGSTAVGAQGSCRTCHSLGRPTLTRWSKLTQEFEADCLASTELPDAAAVDRMLECLRQRAGKPASAFTAAEFGVYAAAAQLPWFAFLFEHASSALQNGTSALGEFVARVGMPRAGRPWTQAEFDVVAEWFERRLPLLYELVPEDSGEDCTPGLDPLLGTYLHGMELGGWRAKNAQAPLLMYGCEQTQAGSACLSGLPRAADQSFAAGWESLAGSQIRILYDNSQNPSSFWSRCSADGRYLGSGLRDGDDNGFGGQIVDFTLGRTIAGDFAYDATFFPDNSGFLVQQGGYNDGAVGVPTDGSVVREAVALICSQSLLASSPEQVSGDDPECTLANGKFGLYQQTAKSVDGDDYWVAHGSYQSDDGGFAATLEDPSAAFEPSSSVTLTPLLNLGSGFEVGNPVQVATPRQGDPTLSPSGGLLVLRAKGREFNTTVDGFDVVAAEQSGYALYAVTKTAGSTSTAHLQDLGRICLQGGKATFSYDERWLVFHHYVRATDATDLGFSGPDDPAFAEYLSRGSSNLVLVDLTTGSAQRITRMQPGQYALFPHFRSDGWIYFDVRTLDGQEWFAASDAALLSEAGP